MSLLNSCRCLCFLSLAVIFAFSCTDKKGESGGSANTDDTQKVAEPTRERTEIEEAAEGGLASLSECYELGVAKDQAFAGKMDLFFIVNVLGMVDGSTILRSTHNAGNVNDCVVDRVKTWTFPEPEEEVMVSYHLEFPPKELNEPITATAYDHTRIAEVLEPELVKMRDCYRKALKTTPELNGDLNLNLTVDSEGKPGEFSFSDNTLKNEAVEACIIDIVKTKTFPAPGYFSVQSNLPLEFSPVEDESAPKPVAVAQAGMAPSAPAPAATKRSKRGSSIDFSKHMVKNPKDDPQYYQKRFKKSIKRRMPIINSCYKMELSRNPDLGGNMTLNFTVDGSGVVTQASISDSTMSNSTVESCILNKVRGFSFTKPESGEVRVSFPIVFAGGR